jgi:hypothetical protein
MQVFRSEEGKRFSLFAPCPSFRLAQIVKESCCIGIGFLDLIPEAGDLMDLEIAIYQGGLPAPGRAGDPDNRPLPHGVEPFKQSFPWKDPAEDRTNNVTHNSPYLS